MVALCYLDVVVCVAFVVASPKRNAAAHRFNVDSSASRGAIVDKQVWEALKQSIPELIHSVDVLDLGDTRAIGGLKRIAASEIAERSKVEVLTVAFDVELFDVIAKCFIAILPSLLVAEIEELVPTIRVAVVQIVFGVLLEMLDRLGNALRLEPK